MANASVEIEDNSLKIKGAINSAMIAWLHEASGELEAEIKRNTRVDTGKLKNSWQSIVDESKGEAVVGSPEENAIWEEFGTGEYAVKGDGRKGYWVYVKGGSSGAKSHGGKSYTLDEAKRVVAGLRAKGLDAYYTKGKRPSRAVEKAVNAKKDKLAKIAVEIGKGMK